MVRKSFICAFALLTLVTAQFGNNDDDDDNNNDNNNDGGDVTTLNEDAIQTGSFSDGTEGSDEDGQSPSDTSQNNFINFCAGQTLTNGLQITEGSCNGIGKL